MTPWELVKKSEHSHQRALFAWANCAAMYGFDIANDPRGYSVSTRDQLIREMMDNGWRPAPPRTELARLFAIHNQGHGDIIRGGLAKAEGVKPGVPDIMLPVPKIFRYSNSNDTNVKYCGLFVELKRPKTAMNAKGTASEIQSDWIEFLREQGYACKVCIGWEDGAAAIRDYLA